MSRRDGTDCRVEFIDSVVTGHGGSMAVMQKSNADY
jgi:hypothetical protein